MKEGKFLKEKYWNREVVDPKTNKVKKPFFDAVQKRVARERRQTGDAPFRSEEQIALYLQSIKKIAERRDPQTGKQGIMLRERVLYPNYIIKKENISDDYIKNIILGNFAELKGYNRDDLREADIRKNILAQFKE